MPAQLSDPDAQRKLDGARAFLQHFVVRRIVEAVEVEAEPVDSFETDAEAAPEIWMMAGRLTIVDFTGNRVQHPYRARLAVLCEAYDRAGCWDVMGLELGQWTYSETASTIATLADLAGTSTPSAGAAAAAAAAADEAPSTSVAAAPLEPSPEPSIADGQAQSIGLPDEPASDQVAVPAAAAEASSAGQDIETLRDLAGQGDPDAQYELAERLRVGYLVTQDPAMALELYGLAAEQGHAEAQFRIGEFYEDGSLVERDPEKAIRFYLQAAEQGHVGAQYALAHMHHLGNGVEQDMAAAMVWYHKAAAQGDEWSQLALGDQYRIGLAVPRDLAQSTGWYRRAAEQGNIFAQYELGNAYRYGNGVEVDIARAIKWYRASAEAGNPSAKLALSEVQARAEGQAGLERPAEVEPSAALAVSGAEVGQDPGGEELVSSEVSAATQEAELAYSEAVMELDEAAPEADGTASEEAPEGGAQLAAVPDGASVDAETNGTAAAEPAVPQLVPQLEPELVPEGPSEASPSGEGEAVALLLSQADAQMARLALTTPEGDNAYETYQRILSLEPENEAAREGLRSIGIRYVSLADRARSRGDWERARRYVDKALELAPGHPEALAMDAALRAQEQEEAASAVSAAAGGQAGEAASPENGASGVAAGAGETGGSDVEVAALTSLSATPGPAGGSASPEAELVTSGLLYAVSGLDSHQAGNYPEAIEYYTLAIKAGDLPAKSLAYVFNNRGASYRNLNQYNRAIEDYDAAIRLNPDYATAFYNRGIAYDRKGFHGLAIDDFDTAIRLNPDLTDAYHQRGLAYVRDGRYDIAIENFSEAIRLDPQLDSAYFNRGLAYQSKGDDERAAEDLKKSHALNPQNQAYGDKLRELGFL